MNQAPLNGLPIPLLQSLLDLGIEHPNIEIIRTDRVVVGLPEFPLETPFVACYNRSTGFIWIETPDPSLLHEVRDLPKGHIVVKGIRDKWAVMYAREEEIAWLREVCSNVE